MNKQLMDIVLPRLARRLYSHLEKHRSGELDDSQFSQALEGVLQKQHAWLADRGVPDVQAALAIHGALVVLSSPGLRAEAEELQLPLEVVEYRTVCAAAEDVAQNYGISLKKAVARIAAIVAKYSD